MAEGKQRVIKVGHQNPVTNLVTKYNEFEATIKNWLDKRSLPVEVAIVTIAGGIEGAAIGGFIGTRSVSKRPCTPNKKNNPDAQVSVQRSRQIGGGGGGALVEARNLAVMSGVNAGVSCVMRRLRGKEDIQTTMVAAFSSGVMFSLVSGMGSPNQAANIISSGVLFALVQGGIHKLTMMLHH